MRPDRGAFAGIECPLLVPRAAAQGPVPALRQIGQLDISLQNWQELFRVERQPWALVIGSVNADPSQVLPGGAVEPQTSITRASRHWLASVAVTAAASAALMIATNYVDVNRAGTPVFGVGRWRSVGPAPRCEGLGLRHAPVIVAIPDPAHQQRVAIDRISPQAQGG